MFRDDKAPVGAGLVDDRQAQLVYSPPPSTLDSARNSTPILIERIIHFPDTTPDFYSHVVCCRTPTNGSLPAHLHSLAECRPTRIRPQRVLIAHTGTVVHAFNMFVGAAYANRTSIQDQAKPRSDRIECVSREHTTARNALAVLDQATWYAAR